MTRQILFFIFVFLPTFYLKAQINISQIYILEFSWIENQKLSFKNPQLASNFNNKGYNNHPFFADSNILIWSSQTPDQNQPDLLIADLERKTIETFTKTTSGEYSTSFRNSQEKNLLSVIRMEFVESDTLVRLWELPLDASHPGKPLFPEILYSGYHLWLNSSEVILFEVGSPNKLVLRSLVDPSKMILLTEWPGRCFKKTKNGDVIFLNQNKEVLRFSPSLNQTTSLGNFPGGGQDFEIMDNDFILASSGKKLLLSNLNQIPLLWTEVIDLSLIEGQKITRIATNNKNKMALVVE